MNRNKARVRMVIKVYEGFQKLMIDWVHEGVEIGIVLALRIVCMLL